MNDENDDHDGLPEYSAVKVKKDAKGFGITFYEFTLSNPGGTK